MLKDITLGQYIPGKSLFHRADPRTKLITIVLFMILLFAADSPTGMVISAIAVFGCVFSARIGFGFVLKSIKPIAFVAVVAGVINLVAISTGEKLVSFWIINITTGGVYTAIRIIVRLVLLVVGASLLTYTTTPIELTDGIEKMGSPLKKVHFPIHEIAMMMTIAIRFIPTLLDETNRIINAQASRGADFEHGGLIKRAKSYIPVLIPLFVSAFRRADELADAMESRCYRGGENRTKMKQLRFTADDAKMTAGVVIYTAAMIAAKILIK